MTMWPGGSARSISRRQRRQKIVGDGAAQAAIGQLDDVVLGAGRVAAAEQQLAVDAELAELVDDDGQPVARRACDSRCRTRLVLPAPRKPVTIVAGMRRMAQAPPFSDQRQPGGDEDDPVGERRDLLVEPAGGVAKPPAERGFRHQPEPDLVGDQHDRPGGVAQRGEQCRRISASSRAPASIRFDSHRVRQSTSIGRPVAASAAIASRQRERRLDGAPEPAAAGAMRGDARRHLGVARLRRWRNRCRARGGRFDEALGVAALARAGAAQHQGDRREAHARAG